MSLFSISDVMIALGKDNLQQVSFANSIVRFMDNPRYVLSSRGEITNILKGYDPDLATSNVYLDEKFYTEKLKSLNILTSRIGLSLEQLLTETEQAEMFNSRRDG